MGRVERGAQNISIQNLIQIALTLSVEVKGLIPSIKQLISPLVQKNINYSPHF
jgi:hypothetical protein